MNCSLSFPHLHCFCRMLPIKESTPIDITTHTNFLKCPQYHIISYLLFFGTNIFIFLTPSPFQNIGHFSNLYFKNDIVKELTNESDETYCLTFFYFCITTLCVRLKIEFLSKGIFVWRKSDVNLHHSLRRFFTWGNHSWDLNVYRLPGKPTPWQHYQQEWRYGLSGSHLQFVKCWIIGPPWISCNQHTRLHACRGWASTIDWYL